MVAILQEQNILLDLPVMTKTEAMKRAADLLFQNGYVEEAYYDMMLQREQECQTYIGNGIGIPHGISHSDALIRHSGIVVLQYKQPIDYDGHPVHLVIGIAGKQNTHIELLSSIACVLQDMHNVEALVACDSKQEILEKLTFDEIGGA